MMEELKRNAANDRDFLKKEMERKIADLEKEIQELRAKVGELVLEIDARKKWAALNGREETAF